MRIGRWLGFMVALLILLFALGALSMMKRQLEDVRAERSSAPAAAPHRARSRGEMRLRPDLADDETMPADDGGASGPSGPSGATAPRAPGEADPPAGIPPGAIW